MKKYIYLFLAVAALAACSRDEKNLFDNSASERMEIAQKTLSTILTSSTTGWEMLYFPTPESAGYAYLMQFGKDGSVRVAAKNAVTTSTIYKEEVSAWGIDGTQGPVLTFSTYNMIFHEFASPGSDGLGHEGDYEFVCLKTTDNHIKLKGKKSGAYVMLNRLPEGQNWKSYFQAIDEFNEIAFLGNDGVDMTYFFGDSTLNVVYDEGVFTYKKGDVEIARGFIITPSGLHFYTGIPYYGDTTKYVKDFDILSDRIQAKGEEYKGYYILSNRTAADFFAYKFEKKNRWTYTAELSDDNTQDAYNAICNQVKAKGATIQSIAYERFKGSGVKPTPYYNLHVNYLVEGKLFEGAINLNYSSKNNQITYSYKGFESSIKPLLDRINDADNTAAAQQIANIFCGTFTPETAGSELNMNKMYLKDGDRVVGVAIDDQIH